MKKIKKEKYMTEGSFSYIGYKETSKKSYMPKGKTNEKQENWYLTGSLPLWWGKKVC